MRRLVITGYKQHELGIFDDNHPGIGFIKKALTNTIIPYAQSGLEWVIVSGQLGVELWATEVIEDINNEYDTTIQIALITPFLEHEKNWNEANQQKYANLKQQADYFVSLTSKPYDGPWQFSEHNKFLIRNSDGMLLVYDSENEGSPKFIKKLAETYAQNNEYEILTISADDLQLIAEEEQMNKWYEQ